MSKAWPMVPLGEVISPVERPETPIPGVEYRQIGVRLWGEGAYERETIDGGQTKYKTFSRVEADDIIVNKIWARNGSVAVVSERLEGCYASGEFPIFTPIKKKMDSKWFHWQTKTRNFWEKCDEKSRGTSGKNRIRPERFLEIEIPLPPLSEQKRTVTKLEELAARIEEARGLRRQAVEEAVALCYMNYKNLFTTEDLEPFRKKLGDVTEILGGNSLPNIPEGIVVTESEILFVKVSDMNLQGNSVVLKTSAAGVEKGSPFLQGVRILPEGSVIFPKRGGAIATNKKRVLGKQAVLDPNMMGVYSKDTSLIDNAYLFAWFKSIDLASLQNGTSVPQINKNDLAPLEFPLPPLSEQRRIVAYLDDLQGKVDALKRLQFETAAEINAMLPSVLDKAFKGELV